MRYTKLFAFAAMAAGILLSTGTAKAQDRYWDRDGDRQHLRRDYARVDALRAAVANDRYRLAEDRRCGIPGRPSRMRAIWPAINGRSTV